MYIDGAGTDANANSSGLVETALRAINRLAGPGSWEQLMGAILPSKQFASFLARHQGHFDEFGQLFGKWLTLPQLKEEYGKLVRAYSSPGRQYHNMLHIHHCLRSYAKVKNWLANPWAVKTAIFFHDEFIDHSAKGNEQTSGLHYLELTEKYNIPQEVCLPAASLIFITDRNFKPTKADQMFIRDIDISNIGAPWGVFKANNRRVKEELKGVFGEDSRTENRFLEQLISQRSIFETRFFEEKYGDRARRNIKRVLNGKNNVNVAIQPSLVLRH